jgi:aspartate/methionine/tyrosine aminotransferase
VLQEIIETVERLGAVLISDEIYHRLEYGQPGVSALEFSDRVFVIDSFSKYFGMTGWRVGWLVAPRDRVNVLNMMAQNHFISVNTLSQEAALAAIDSDVLPEYEDRRIRLGRRREFLCEALVDLGFPIPCEPRGAFYIYADASKFSSDSYQLALDILEHAHVVVTPGQDFREGTDESFIRFSYTASLADLREAVLRLQSFLAGYDRER